MRGRKHNGDCGPVWRRNLHGNAEPGAMPPDQLVHIPEVRQDQRRVVPQEDYMATRNVSNGELVNHRCAMWDVEMVPDPDECLEKGLEPPGLVVQQPVDLLTKADGDVIWAVGRHLLVCKCPRTQMIESGTRQNCQSTVQVAE